jgi:hypothetical protein
MSIEFDHVPDMPQFNCDAPTRRQRLGVRLGLAANERRCTGAKRHKVRHRTAPSRYGITAHTSRRVPRLDAADTCLDQSPA